MHELAYVSGIVAAYRLGADYVKFDNFAEASLANTCCYPMELGMKLRKGEERERSIRSRCYVSSACLQ
jgi:hypothetical protein